MAWRDFKRERRRDFYRGELLAFAPRLLSAQDRCPASASGGSFDREYWAWASKDFANLDLQRHARVLAYLFRTPFEGNIYHGQKGMLGFMAQAVEFWISRQDSGGAFDHLYPYEGSWMAAAFTLADMVDAWRLAGRLASPELRGRWLAAMRRAGDCLTGRDELHGFISNHRAGAAAGLLGLAELTGRERYRRRAWELLEGIYRRQSPEGWFLEYEGADPGYQTLDTHYQAACFLETGRDQRILEAAERSLDFLAYFFHPDGSVGGEYGSRGCPHYFPGGMEVFACRSPIAETMARLGAWGLASGQSCGLADSDDRNAAPMAVSYVQALQALEDAGERAAAQAPFERRFQRIWPQAGFYVRSDRSRYTILGASKGGVIKVFNKGEPSLEYSNCGYAGRLQGGGQVASLLWTTSPRLEAGGLRPGSEQPLGAKSEALVEAPFFFYRSDRLMSPLKMLLFRIFNLTAGRVRALNDFVRKHLIIGKFLTARKPAPLNLRRRLIWTEEGACRVEDVIRLSAKTRLADMREHGFFSAVYMASARYFRRQDLVHSWSSPNLAEDLRGDVITRRTDIWGENG